MNQIPFPFVPGMRARLSLWLAIALGFAAPAAPAAPPPQAKPYTLFLGVNVDVQQGNELCRVQGVEGSRLIARVNGKLASIPTDAGPIRMRVRQAFKLAPASSAATLAGLTVDRAYTPGSDPVRKFFRQQPGSAGVQQYDMAQGQALEAATLASAIPADALASIREAAQHAAQAAQQNANQVLAQTSGDGMYDFGSYVAMMNEEAARKLYDAVEINFKVSSPVPLNSPYLVIVIQFHEPDAPPHTVRNWIFAQSMDSIGPKPHRVSILRGGFPKGYELKKYEIHLFNRGKEVLTSASTSRLALTSDEAFEYGLADYVSSHKGMNVPATPAITNLPADLRAHIAGAAYRQTYYVKVSKDGMPEGVYVDPYCRKRSDNSYLENVVRNMRFNPELDKGRPVPGTALLNLSRLH